MEIDFLGLNSPKFKQENPNNPYIDAGGGVEISLSLSSSSPLNFSERKKWEFAACENMISSSCSTGTNTVYSLPSYTQEKTEQLLLVAPPVFRPTAAAAAAGFLYDLNDAAATVNLRNMYQRTCPNVFIEPKKADQNKVYNMSGNATTGGYTPTVAMARRATLARFLEKRLHRLNQARAPHIMGRSTNSQPCEIINNKGNKP